MRGSSSFDSLTKLLFEKKAFFDPSKIISPLFSATNQDLEQAITQSKFRTDLFYRINVVNIHLPPLRERVEDIPQIADFFIRKFSRELRKNISGFSSETMGILQNHNWPGKIRYLKFTNVTHINYLGIIP